MKKTGFRSLCALALALLLAIPMVSAFAENNAYVKYTSAGRINLREGASSTYKVLASIAPGTSLEVHSVNGKWAYVTVANPDGGGDLNGYMFTEYIEYTSYTPDHIYSVGMQYDWQSSPPSASRSVFSSQYPTITENTTMYICTGNGGGLNLREYPSQNVRSLGLYPNGTQVTVLSRSGSWAFVNVNGAYGYMMLDYLALNSYTPVDPVQPISGGVVKYVSTGNSGRLHLREYASQSSRSLGLYPNGTRVLAVNLNNGWSYVNVNGAIGYMMSRFLTDSAPSQYTLMYVNTGSSAKLNLRSGMSSSASSLGSFANGTAVYVIANYGSWAYVTVDGLMGFMPTNCLTASRYIPQPGPSIGTAVVSHPNGSFVYLRSSRSTDSLDNVLAKVPSGAMVTLYQKDEWYSLVQYNGIIGYMVSHYLNSGVGSATVPAPSSNTVIKMIVDGAALRSSRDESDASNILMTLPHGAMVEILLTYPDNWRYIDYNGVKGYIHGQNVATVPENTNTSTSSGGTMGKGHTTCDTYLCLNPKKTTDGNILADVPSDETVDILGWVTGDGNGWYKVRYNGMVGYMISKVLGMGAAATVPTVPAGTVIGIGVVNHPNGSFVNLRYSRSTEDNSNVLEKVPSGAKVEVMEHSGSWSKVRYNGVVGYMVSSYILFGNESSSSTAPGSVSSAQLMPAQSTGVSVTTGKREVRNNNSGFVYLRSSKDSSNTDNVLMKVYNGTTVDLLRDEGSWSFVSVNGTTGYMVSIYLALDDPYYSPNTQDSPSRVTPAQFTSAVDGQKPASVPATQLMPATRNQVPSADTNANYKRVRDNINAYLRSSKDNTSSGNILFKVPSGTYVEVLAQSEWWSKVRYESIEGYMISSNLI